MSAQIYQVGAHLEALIDGILMAPLKTFESSLQIWDQSDCRHKSLVCPQLNIWPLLLSQILSVEKSARLVVCLLNMFLSWSQ